METIFCWDKLQNELRVHVMKFISMKERSRIALASKSVRAACYSVTTIFPNIKGGILPVEYAKPFSLFLHMLRGGVYRRGLGFGISKKAEQVLRNDPDSGMLHDLGLVEDVMLLNSRMYTFWEHDHSGEPGTGLHGYGKIMAEYNPTHEFCSMIEPSKHWGKHRISGNVFLVKERPDGTIIVSEDMEKVYLVQGILVSAGGLVTRIQRRLPVMGVASFLPLHEYIAFDGLFMGNPTDVDAATRKKLLRVYAAAADKGAIITRLDIPKDQRSSSGAGAPRAQPAAPALPIELSSLQKANFAKLKAIRKVDCPAASWVFRRHDYTEERNPEHLVTIMAGNGMPVLMGATTAKLQPTALEIFEILCYAVLGTGRGSGMLLALPGLCPHNINTDELTIVEPLRTLLEPAGIAVAYYPPPSQEEHMVTCATGGCAACHVPDSVLKNEGLPGLSSCARCLGASYCSRACQKAHWKVHKKVCKKAAEA